jgi:uncharacterized protein YdhG (YjbR/CyaY superfamily)
MQKSKQIFTINEYISTFPDDVQLKLEQIRQIIRESAPESEETIKYRMPTFTLNGNLVHFAGYARHIGFYPTPGPIEEFKKELSPYKTSKGAIQFPLDKDLPIDLIRRIVEFRRKENKMENN